MASMGSAIDPGTTPANAGSASAPQSAPQTVQTPSAQPSSNNWANAANVAAGPVAGQPSPASAATPPANATPVQAPPTTAQAVRPGGLRGFIDKALDSIAGTDTSRVRKDADGTLYIDTGHATRGQQWLKVAGIALSGSAAGMAAGHGAGNWAKAPEAGVKAGQQIQDRQTEQEKNQQLEVANSQKLKHEIVAQSLAMTRMQVEAGEHAIEFSQKQADRLKSEGSEFAAHVNILPEQTKFMRDTPNFNKDQVDGHGMYTPVATFGPDGKANGFDLYKKTPGSDEEILPAGTEIPFFNPVKNEMQYQKTAGPMKRADINAAWMAQGKAQQDFALKQAEIDEKEGAAKKAAEGPQETASMTSVHEAEAYKDYKQGNAAAEKAADKGNSGALVDAIGNGQMDPGRLSYLMSKNPQLLADVADKYPDFDSSKLASYGATYKDFTEGKTSVALNSGGTALGHLKELQALNTTMSHIPGTAAYNAYQNKADTLATELAKFYGDSTVSGIDAIKRTLTSTLPGTRDAAIRTQAQSMGDKLDAYEQQWHNAAPSAAYQAPMPGISNEAKEARAALDPAYRARRVAQAGGAQQQQKAAPPETHAFSLSAWQRANPGGNAAAAQAAAKQAGYNVVQ